MKTPELLIDLQCCVHGFDWIFQIKIWCILPFQTSTIWTYSFIESCYYRHRLRKRTGWGWNFALWTYHWHASATRNTCIANCLHCKFDLLLFSWTKRIDDCMYSISQEICTRFCCALLCCGYAIVHNEFTWSIYPYSSGLLCWHWGNC